MKGGHKEVWVGKEDINTVNKNNTVLGKLADQYSKFESNKTTIMKHVKLFEEFVNEKIDTELEDKIADLYGWAGTDVTKFNNDDLVKRYGEEVLGLAKKMIPEIQRFEKNTAKMLSSIKNDKSYSLYQKMVDSSNNYGGGHGIVEFKDVLSSIIYSMGIK
jgi:hypothetical protein